jgi:hypothetical protein
MSWLMVFWVFLLKVPMKCVYEAAVCSIASRINFLKTKPHTVPLVSIPPLGDDY